MDGHIEVYGDVAVYLHSGRDAKIIDELSSRARVRYYDVDRAEGVVGGVVVDVDYPARLFE